MDWSTHDTLVFLVVVLGRFILPLLIPFFPLPAVLACMVLDGMDQTILANNTTTMDGFIFGEAGRTGSCADECYRPYDGYDKALDIYYLSMAYLATLRNWRSATAFGVSKFLYYYRLVGTLLVELTHWRALLLIFPNTFEYFYMAIEGVRLRWDPRRMPKRLIIFIAAFIWIVIKLPQEYWIHIAKLDMTDAMASHPWIKWVMAIGAVVIAVVGWYIVTRKCPPPDWRFQLRADAPGQGQDVTVEQIAEEVRRMSSRLFSAELLEKVVLVGFVSVIFGQVLPDRTSTNLELAVGIAIMVVANTVVSEALIRRGWSYASTLTQFVVMLAVNMGMVVLAWWILPGRDGEINVPNTMFFMLLLTLIVTLYDRFRPIHLARRRVASEGLA